jgi:hypothetical protein
MTDDRRTAILNGYPVTPEFLERFEQSQAVLTYDIAGAEWPRVRYGDEKTDWGAQEYLCHDCRASAGQFHVIGCDVEQCPRCGEQAIMCDCEEEEDEAASEDRPRGPMRSRNFTRGSPTAPIG